MKRRGFIGSLGAAVAAGLGLGGTTASAPPPAAPKPKSELRQKMDELESYTVEDSPDGVIFLTDHESDTVWAYQPDAESKPTILGKFTKV